jgi:hypothetical protein
MAATPSDGRPVTVNVTAVVNGHHGMSLDVKKAITLVFTKNYGLLWTTRDRILVEPAGIEPASASPLQAVLHT